MAKHPTPRKWSPRHPEKYIGDVNNIISRSSWETKFLNWCDLHPDVLLYTSEELVVPYFSPVDQRMHRYFVDFVIKIKTRSGEIKKIAVEIKPEVQTLPPKQPKNNGKKAKERFLTEAATFAVNTAKWEAADAFCKKNGMEFVVFTEKHLNV